MSNLVSPYARSIGAIVPDRKDQYNRATAHCNSKEDASHPDNHIPPHPITCCPHEGLGTLLMSLVVITTAELASLTEADKPPPDR